MIVTALLVLGFWAGAGAKEKDAKEVAAQKKPKPKFTIGKQTTYVNGPLDEDGTIDYSAALNKRMRQGVTPANNANVLIWKALGPHPEGGTMHPEFFKWLESPAPPEQGDYFIDLYRFMKEERGMDLGKQGKQIDDQLEHCTHWPWTPKEYPDLAAWLKANDKPLAVAVAASKRTHYYSPLVTKRAKGGSSGLIGALLPAVQKCRALASALTARAMERVGQGRPQDAWQDLLATHRLGRLVARGGTLIEMLVGFALDAIAGQADLAFLESARLNAQQTESCLRDLQKLPPMPPLAGKIDLGERFMFLDCVMLLARGGIRALEGLSGGRPIKKSDPAAERFWREIDWDPALRTGNKWYDRMTAALREKERSNRVKKLKQIETDLKALKNKTVESGVLAQLVQGKGPARAVGQGIGDVLVTLLIPAVQKVEQAADRTEQLHTNRQLAFALAAYRLEHGHYPKKLDVLAPRYLAAIPPDLFSGKPLIYRPSAKGYLLYSVGVNGKDEGGRGYDDEPKGDDLSVRMPLPRRQRK
jgi:hypothetical protein